MKTTKRSQHVSAASVRALALAGFSPAGVVFGNSTMHIARPMMLSTRSRLSSGVRGWSGDEPGRIPSPILAAQRLGDSNEVPPWAFRATYPCPHAVAGQMRRMSDHFTGFNFELPGPGAALDDCFVQAQDLLVERAAQRGAHGVIDVRVGLEGDALFHGLMSLTLAGTAVVAPGAPPLERPFTTTVSAQGLVKLIDHGLFPTCAGFGAVLMSAWAGCGTRVALDSGYAGEVDQLADLVTGTRNLAAERMRDECGECSVALDVSITHSFTKASKADYRVAAWAVGSGARAFTGARPGDTKPIVLLDQR